MATNPLSIIYNHANELINEIHACSDNISKLRDLFDTYRPKLVDGSGKTSAGRCTFGDFVNYRYDMKIRKTYYLEFPFSNKLTPNKLAKFVWPLHELPACCSIDRLRSALMIVHQVDSADPQMLSMEELQSILARDNLIRPSVLGTPVSCLVYYKCDNDVPTHTVFNDSELNRKLLKTMIEHDWPGAPDTQYEKDTIYEAGLSSSQYSGYKSMRMHDLAMPLTK